VYGADIAWLGEADATVRNKPATAGTDIFVVDRREGRYVVIVDDGGRSINVSADRLPKGCRAEGAILRVARAATGEPDWPTATRDRGAEVRRREELARRVGRLRDADAGGDITL
jgi:hypothetical protein